MTDRAIPNLPSRDFPATERFYGGFGFRASYRDEGWMVLNRGDIQLEFFSYRDFDPTKSSFMCSIRVQDVDTLYRAIRDSGVDETRAGFPRLMPIERQSWGQRVGYFIDVDGTQLNLIEDAG